MAKQQGVSYTYRKPEGWKEARRCQPTRECSRFSVTCLSAHSDPNHLSQEYLLPVNTVIAMMMPILMTQAIQRRQVVVQWQGCVRTFGGEEGRLVPKGLWSAGGLGCVLPTRLVVLRW